VLGDFKDQPWCPVLDLKGIQDRWKVVVELDIDDGTNDCDNAALAQRSGGIVAFVCGQEIL
jgi:hypothetical protein